jgi:hypothetical protein
MTTRFTGAYRVAKQRTRGKAGNPAADRCGGRRPARVTPGLDHRYPHPGLAGLVAGVTGQRSPDAVALAASGAVNSTPTTC